VHENIDEIVAEQFDFVCNGVEMASGAVRNHDPEVMKNSCMRRCTILEGCI